MVSLNTLREVRSHLGHAAREAWGSADGCVAPPPGKVVQIAQRGLDGAGVRMVEFLGWMVRAPETRAPHAPHALRLEVRSLTRYVVRAPCIKRVKAAKPLPWTGSPMWNEPFRLMVVVPGKSGPGTTGLPAPRWARVEGHAFTVPCMTPPPRRRGRSVSIPSDDGPPARTARASSPTAAGPAGSPSLGIIVACKGMMAARDGAAMTSDTIRAPLVSPVHLVKGILRASTRSH